MPLPLIPVGLAVASVLGGAFGIKKGMDAKSDYNSAKRWNKKAQELFDSAKADLESARESSQNSLEELGKTKFEILENSILPYVDAISKVKHFDYKSEDINEGDLRHDGGSLAIDLTGQSLVEMKELVSGGVTSLGAGGLAGLAAYGGVGMLGTASTGTAIGSLTGVAASNATLAWLGGGSLASGGLGMAGGTAVLGGIVAGPVLAVGGMMLASKAEEAKENAWANFDLAEVQAEEMGLARVKTEAIGSRLHEMNDVLISLNDEFIPLLQGLEKLIQEEPRRLSEARSRLGIVVVNLIDETIRIKILAEERSKGLLNKIKNIFLGNPVKKQIQTSLEAIAVELDSDRGRHFFSDLSGYDLGGEQLSKSTEDLRNDKEMLMNFLASDEPPEISFTLLDKKNQEGLHMAFSLAKTLDSLIKTKILNEDGSVVEESGEAVASGNIMLASLRENKTARAA